MATLRVWDRLVPVVPLYNESHNSLMRLKNDAIKAVTEGTPRDYKDAVEDVALDIQSGVLAPGQPPYFLYFDNHIVELIL